MAGSEAAIEKQAAAAREAQTRQIEAHGVTFSNEQAAKIGAALFEAELAILNGIAREAARLESFDAARNIPRLVAALQGLRSCMGQGTDQQGVWATTIGTGGWSGYTPLHDDDEP